MSLAENVCNTVGKTVCQWFGIDRYVALQTQRESQLNKQREIDQKIQQKYRACSSIYAEYLLLARQQNRDKSLAFYKCHWSESSSVLKKQLDEEDAIQKEVEGVLSSKDHCKTLKQWLAKNASAEP